MKKRLTLTISEDVYAGLRKDIRPRKISRFIEDLVRPYIIRFNLESAYAEMARDTTREKEALEWAEMISKDSAHETM